MNSTPLFQRYALYLLVFAAAGALTYIIVKLLQGFSMEYYERRAKSTGLSGHRNDIGYFIAPGVLLQIQLSLASLLLGGVVSILLFCHVFYWYAQLPAGLIAVAAGFALPWLYFARKVKKRAAEFDGSILDLAQGLANGMRAGQALPQALEVFARRSTGPMHEELAIVLKEYRLGLELTDALQRMYDRLPCEDLQLLIVSIRLTLQSGGSLADVLLRISQTIRSRIEFHQKLQALTAQGRFEALAMSLAPLFAFILLFMVNNELMLPMVTTLIGWCAIGVMLILEAVGYMAIRAIVSIKV